MRLPPIKNEKGTSFLEIIVALALFAIVILAVVAIFKMVIDGQRSAISAQNVQENMRYALEKMSKEIRMAQISNTECLAWGLNKVFNADNGNEVLHFKNKNNVCVRYFLDQNRLKITVGSGLGAVSEFITPGKIIVSNLKFYVDDDLIGAFHAKQPYVTMAMDVKAVGLAMHEQEMKLQITVSSRYYE